MIIVLSIVIILLLYLIFKFYLFTNFKGKLMNAFGQYGLEYNQANDLYTLHAEQIHELTLYKQGLSSDEIAKNMFSGNSSLDQIITQIYTVINNSLRSYFYHTEYFDHDNNKIQFPPGIIQDPYIMGYISNWINMFMNFEFSNHDLSYSDKGHIAKEVIRSIFSELYYDDLVEDILEYQDKDHINHSMYQDGVTHSTMTHLATIGGLKKDLKNPILDKAKEMTLNSDLNKDLSYLMNEEVDFNIALGMHLQELTLNKYLNDKFSK